MLLLAVLFGGYVIKPAFFESDDESGRLKTAEK